MKFYKRSKTVSYLSKVFLALYIGLNFVPEFKASNILFFHLTCSPSHRISIWPLAEKLADSGHSVTYIYPLSRRPGYHPKIEELKPSKLISAVDVIMNVDVNLRLNNSLNQWVINALSKVPGFCEDFYDSPEIVEWLARPNLHYDLILIDGALGQCAYGLVHKFQAKHILFNPMTLPNFWDSFGIVPETSSIPGFFQLKPGEFSKGFWKRVADTLGIALVRLLHLYTMSSLEAVVKTKLNVEGMPSFMEMEQDTSLVLQNSYFIDDYAVSLPPMFVSYSGMHCTEKSRQNRKSLPEKLENFIKGRDTDGFIYVSFGSAANMTTMPDELLSQFFTAFESFPRLKFLWRWDGPIPKSVPSNVLLEPWFPQLDVLAHQKIKAFITQAGRPSTQEAICYAVPMIAIPIFAEQDFNTYRIEYIGAGLSLDITTLTAKKMENAIQTIINKTYKERLTELSEMYRNRPVDPVENVLFWVKYVLKYNTSLLKPLAMHQTWWQRRLLDVYAFIFTLCVIIFVIIFLICYLILKICCKCLFKSKTKEKVN